MMPQINIEQAMTLLWMTLVHRLVPPQSSKGSEPTIVMNVLD